MILWGWFISPTFDLTSLSLTQAIGLNIFISLFTTRSNLEGDQFSRRVIFFLTLLVALGLGWIVHLFMQSHAELASRRESLAALSAAYYSPACQFAP